MAQIDKLVERLRNNPKNVKFTDLEKVLKADVIEMNIKTKDTKIFMYEDEKKVNIRSTN